MINIYSQITKDYAVPLNAITNTLEPSITLYWTASSANSFSIYRKLKIEFISNPFYGFYILVT